MTGSPEKQRVVCNGAFSRWADVLSGVPQGSVLGQILFLIYINDIGDSVKKLINLFADDTKLSGAVSTAKERDSLQEDINSLHDWAEKWQMQFNADKCSVIHMGRNNIQHTYKLGGTSLQTSHCERDVGVLMQDDAKFSGHCSKAAKKCNQILGQVKRSFNFKTPKVMLNIYKTYILPHLTYGSVIWRPYLQKDIAVLESVQRRFTKMILGMGHLSYQERLSALNLPSVEERGRREDLVHTYRILNGIDDIGCELFKKASDTHNRNTRSSTKENLSKENSNLNLRRNFLSNRVVNDWNLLPKELQTARSLTTFKSMLKTVRL